MLGRSGNSGDICGLVELLATQVASLEQAANETGVSLIYPSTSETLEMTLLHAVATLRRIRNSGRPVNKLPPEILSRVFFFVRHHGHALDNLSHEFGLHTVGEPVASLLPLLRVCSRWRSIATTSSFLWSMIDNRDLFALSISSKYRPVSGLLDVHIIEHFLRPADFDFRRHPQALRCFRDFNLTFVDLLRNEGHRIREFFASVPAVLLPALMDFPGESLRACELWPLEGALDDLGAIRPLFNAWTPKLRSLVIGNLLFIPSNHFPSLTHLLLAGGVRSTAPDGPFTFANFLLFLSHCPNLQVLHLYDLDVIQLQELPDDRVFAPLNLRYLRKFSNEEVLHDHTGAYFRPRFRRALLANLQLSPDCIIRLSTVRPETFRRTLHSLPFDEPFTSVYLGAHNYRPLNTNALNALGPECFSIMATDPRRQRGMHIDFQMLGTRYTPPNISTIVMREWICDAICSAPLLSGVEALWVVPAANLLLWEPNSLLAAFPHLTTLVLGLFQSAPIPATINGVENQMVAGWDRWDPLSALEVCDDLVIPCPRLRTLCVYITTERQAMRMYDVVLSCGEAGYPIHRLVVGFYEPPELTVLELVEGLWGLVEDFKLIKQWESCPDDLCWVQHLPSGCRDSSEHNSYWPAWM